MMSTTLLVTLAASAVVLAVYALANVVIWRRRYERLAPDDRGPASVRANIGGLLIYSLWIGVIGLAAIIIGGQPIARQAISAGWPTTQGEITRAEVEPRVVTGRVRSQQWQPVVTYRYTVDGQTYTGDQVTFSQPQALPQREDVEEIVAPYAVGDTVSVIYAPDAPQTAVLQREVRTESYLIAGGGLLVMALHLLGQVNNARVGLPIGRPYTGPYG